MNRAVYAFGVTLLLASGMLRPATATQSTVTWNGVTLGEPVIGLRPTFGDPIRIVNSADGKTRIARYWIAGSRSTYFLVLERAGYVIGLEAFTQSPPTSLIENVPADPSGVHLGDTVESVQAAHPSFHSQTSDDGTPQFTGKVSDDVAALYEFQGGRVVIFHWGTRISESEPPLQPLTEPSGESLATALSDMQANESNGAAWEYLYLSFHPCDGATLWKLQTQSLMKDGGRFYDRLHVICPTSQAERDFFFDITSYYGKL